MMLVFERVLFPRVRFLPAFAPFHDVQPMIGRQKQHAADQIEQLETGHESPWSKDQKNKFHASTPLLLIA